MAAVHARPPPPPLSPSNSLHRHITPQPSLCHATDTNSQLPCVLSSTSLPSPLSAFPLPPPSIPPQLSHSPCSFYQLGRRRLCGWLEMRVVWLCSYMLMTMLTGCVFWGWAKGLRDLLLRDGAYAWLCEDSSDSLSSSPTCLTYGICAAQDVAVNNLLTYAAVSNLFCAAFAGIMLDSVGPRMSAMVGCVVKLSGWLLLSFSGNSFVAYIPAFVLIGGSTDFTHLPTLASAGALFKRKGIAISLLGASNSLSSTMALIMYGIAHYNSNNNNINNTNNINSNNSYDDDGGNIAYSTDKSLSYDNITITSTCKSTVSFRTVCLLYACISIGIYIILGFLFLPKSLHPIQSKRDATAGRQTPTSPPSPAVTHMHVTSSTDVNMLIPNYYNSPQSPISTDADSLSSCSLSSTHSPDSTADQVCCSPLFTSPTGGDDVTQPIRKGQIAHRIIINPFAMCEVSSELVSPASSHNHRLWCNERGEEHKDNRSVARFHHTAISMDLCNQETSDSLPTLHSPTNKERVEDRVYSSLTSHQTVDSLYLLRARRSSADSTVDDVTVDGRVGAQGKYDKAEDESMVEEVGNVGSVGGEEGGRYVVGPGNRSRTRLSECVRCVGVVDDVSLRDVQDVPYSSSCIVGHDSTRKPTKRWCERSVCTDNSDFLVYLCSLRYLLIIPFVSIALFRVLFISMASSDLLGPTVDAAWGYARPMTFTMCIAFGCLTDLAGVFVTLFVVNALGGVLYLLVLGEALWVKYLALVVLFVFSSYCMMSLYVYLQS
eukprot:GHVQ01015150.1.p1 GENE.GHVQ01015150.1~~GHVQ01015150.1.p1  ORF type:complete len:771 (+),score=122.16 GHVQ01015150.1:264-2576(+)